MPLPASIINKIIYGANVILFKVIELMHSRTQAIGATMGQAHVETIRQSLETESLKAGDDHTVIIDFTGIEEANGSYLRATVIYLHHCAYLYAGGPTPQQSPANYPWIPVPLNIFPFVAHMGETVAADLQELLAARQ